MPEPGEAVVWVVAGFLCLGGVVNIVGPAPLRRDYRRWGYPARFGIVTGTLLVVAAGLMASPGWLPHGVILAGATTLAALATLLWHREYSHTPPSIVLLLVLAWIGAGQI